MLPQVEGASAAGEALSAEAEEDSGAGRGKPPTPSFGGHGSAFRPAEARPALHAPAAWQSTRAAADGHQQAAHVRHDTGPSEQDTYTAAGAAEGEGSLIYRQKPFLPVMSMMAFWYGLGAAALPNDNFRASCMLMTLCLVWCSQGTK